jgi:phage shock protein PspC (stress-responsive transcriptional regulator)
LVEIGPVEVPAATAEGAPAMSGAAGGPEGGARPGTGLRQVSEGAWISGVCNGIARGAGLDVTLVRVIAVLLLFVSGGAMILLYAVLMLLLPYSPVDPQAQPLRWLPAKSRELVLAIRAKLSALMG